MNPICLETMDLLARALQLMDGEGLHHVAARIAMAMDDLSGNRRNSDRPIVH